MIDFLQELYDLRPILLPIALTITLVGLVLLRIGLAQRADKSQPPKTSL